MLWTRAVRRGPMTPLRLVLAGAAGSAAADFGDQDPRGLTHTVIGSLVVRGNRLAISNSSSLSGCELHGSSQPSEEGLEQEFNSLQAQSEACEAYIRSQRHEGWILARTHYDDGGFSGGNIERPALQRLLADIRGGRIDIIVVYKVDRLTRSLADFARLVEIFDAQGVSFVSVTQQFNTTSSMGRLTLNVLLSFAQFEREVTGERIRDKIAASKKKGMWMGGNVPLGYDANERTLVVNAAEPGRCAISSPFISISAPSAGSRKRPTASD